MGSGASKNKAKKSQNIKNKVLAVGVIGTKESAKDTSHSNQRSIVITDTSAAWELLRGGADTVDTTDVKKEVLTFDGGREKHNALDYRKGEDAEEATGVVYDTLDKVEQDETCDICKTDSGYIKYPCRICTRTFHEQCLLRVGQCQDERSINCLKRADSEIGWTCHICENINTILSEDEMTKLIEDFDEHDVNNDSEINRTEFIQYKKESHSKRYGSYMSQGEINLETQRFDCMDVDGTGTIDWWEFLNYESIACLQRRKQKNSVVAALSRKEIQRARESFHIFDVDRNGSVTEREAREAYKNWYKQYFGTDGQTRSTNAAIESHIDSSVKVLMSADDDDTGVISWDEYLRDQAVNYISARPNSTTIFHANQIGMGLSKSSSYMNLKKV